MDIFIKYDQFEKLITKVESYKDLVKGVRQSFKYLLKNNFTLFYFDEDEDKIVISNQADFEALQPAEQIEIIVEANEEDLSMTDDSFQKLDKSVKETVSQFRKLSNSIKDQETKQQFDPAEVQAKQLIEQSQKEKQQLEQCRYEEKRQKIITDLQSTVTHIKSQILLIDKDDKEAKLKAKLSNLEQPQQNTKPFKDELMSIELLVKIDEAEKKMLTLNKTERAELKFNYQSLQKQISKIIIAREKSNQQYIVLNKDYNKQVQKIELAIVKTQRKNEKSLKQLRQLLKQYETKMAQAQKKKCDLDSLQYMNKEQLEKYLDDQMKEEIKNKKQKQEALKKEKQQMDQIINLENNIPIIKQEEESSEEFNDSFGIE